MNRVLRSAFFVAILAASAPALAHVEMMYPKPRYPNTDIKYRPCGRKGGKRTTNVTTFKPGETITVMFHEFIGHPGHYRISFDADGEDDFVDPKTGTELNSAPSVLVDGIKDKTGMMTYTQDITFPDVECGNCTLQLIQVMTDKAPFGNGDDIYYVCADLILSKTGMPPDSGAAADGPEDAAGGAGGGGGQGGGQDDAGAGGGSGGRSAAGGCSYGGATCGITGSMIALVFSLTSLRLRAKRMPHARKSLPFE